MLIEHCQSLSRVREWQSTAVLLPGKSHGQRSLVDYRPWGYKQSDMTEPLHFQQMGEGKLTHVGLSWGHSPWDARHFLSHSVLVTWLLGPTQIVLGWEMTTLASSHPSCLLALRWTIWYLRSKFSSLCCCSVAKSFPTLWDPTDCSTPGLPVLHYLLEFVQIHVHWVDDAIQLSHLLVAPFSSYPQFFPASGSFPMSQLFTPI